MSDLRPKQPTPMLKREVKLKPLDLFGALKDLAQLNYLDAGEKLIKSIGLKGNRVEEAAWRIVLLALLKASHNLVNDTRQSLATNLGNVNSIEDDLARGLSLSTDALTSDLFKHPKRLDVLKSAKPALKAWGITYGLNDAEATAFAEKAAGLFRRGAIRRLFKIA